MTDKQRPDIFGLRQETAVFLIIFIAGVSLRFVALGSHSLWTDEFYTLNIVRASRLLTEGVPSDQHPPLYYLLMENVIRQGTSEYWLRLPSALFSSLGILFMWRSGHVLGKAKFGLIAAALFAFAPLLIWYGREARMYGVASFLWAGSLYFYTRTIYKDTWFDFLGLALLTLAAIMTTYASFALWLVEIGAFFLLWYFAGAHGWRLIKWLIAQILIGYGFFLWFPYFQVQMGRALVFNWRLPGPFGDLVDISGTLAETITRGLAAGVAGLLVILLLSLLIIRVPRLQQWLKRLAKPTAVFILFLLLAVTIAGVIPRGLSIRRQLLVLLPVLILAGSWALITLNHQWLTGVFIILTFLGGVVIVLSPPYENWKEAVAYVQATAVPGDIVVVTPGWNTDSFDYYDTGMANFLLLRGGQEGQLTPNNPTEMSKEEAEDKAFHPGQKVWIAFNSHPSLMIYSELLLNRMAENGRLRDQLYFPNNVTILVYEME